MFLVPAITNQGVFQKNQMAGLELSKPTFLTRSISKRVTESIVIFSLPDGPRTSMFVATVCGRRLGTRHYTFRSILRSFQPTRRNLQRLLVGAVELMTRNGMMSALTASRGCFEKCPRRTVSFKERLIG